MNKRASTSSSTSVRFLRDREIRSLTGLSKTTIWRLERTGRFPRRRKLAARAAGWVASEVESWLQQRALEG
jgi:prophage regulatory protein